MIKAVIFDMDGLLIESEHLWRQVMRECFAKYDFELTEADCLKSMGRRIDETIEFWKKERNLVCNEKELFDDIISTVRGVISKQAEIMPGAREIFDFFKSKSLPIAIASTSPEVIIRAGVERVGVSSYLSAIASAEHEAKGKPDPGVYLTAAKKIGIAPENCLAFEDSAMGVLAAKAAGMKCISVPDPLTNVQIVKDNADYVLSSLLEITPEFWDNFTKA